MAWPGAGEAIADAPKMLTFYELDLGLNHVVRAPSSSCCFSLCLPFSISLSALALALLDLGLNYVVHAPSFESSFSLLAALKERCPPRQRSRVETMNHEP